jgi:hypothetical protein
MAALAGAAGEIEAMAMSYVHEIPDHCDRIVWRGRYYHLESMQPVEAPPAECEHLRSDLLAEKQTDGQPLFQMRKCLDCDKTFRVRSYVTAPPTERLREGR